LQNAPQCAVTAFVGLGNCGVSGDYELSSHVRGFSGDIVDQINSQNLIHLSADYTQASVLRDNNTEFYNGFYGPDSINARTAIGVLVDSSNPTNDVFVGSQ
jgi:hypothetical protein